jgi:hypothetical protein
MKHLKPLAIILLILWAGSRCGCENGKDIIIGDTYKLCNGIDSSTVTVEAKVRGYVKYCWSPDYGKPDHTSFSRSYSEFTEEINNCK